MDDKSKPGFMVYHDKFAMIDRLPDAQFHQFMRAVYQYSLDGSAVEFDDPALSVVFAMWQQLIDADTERYNRRREAARNAINSRWKRNNADTNVYEPIPTNTDGYKAIRSDTKNTNNQQSIINNQQSSVIRHPSSVNNHGNGVTGGTVRKRTTFTPPTVADVEAYCAEKSYRIDAEHFVDYYESNGWRVGRNSMKDWKAAVRVWASNESSYSRGSSGRSQAQAWMDLANSLGDDEG